MSSEEKILGSTNVPIYIFICMCLLLTISQFVIKFLQTNITPSLTALSSNCVCSMSCACVIYILGLISAGPAWGCALLLILCMISSFISTISNTAMSAYVDPDKLVYKITGEEFNFTLKPLSESTVKSEA